jgi:molecular chaperone HtpG
VAPYRSVSQEEHAEAPRDTGIVGDIIAQFADPLAFYRELVQNAIDADSPSVDIELVHDTRVMLVRVRDRGCGMTRDVLENQLLVLFRSTKEKDDSKIGKFGIGFASVLAPNPNVVVVQTARDGRRLAMHLQRDLTFQIFDAGPATQTGTTVELELACKAEEAPALVQRSIDALVRWCRHATVPIELRAEAPGMEKVVARIDRPLGLEDAVVAVRGVSEDGALTAIVGIASDAAPYAGFFNHGLTLYETREPLVGRLAFKIQDARLGHTLSRDNVRRDESFTRALGFVRSLAERQLPAAISQALRGTANDTDVTKWQRLALTIIVSRIGLDPDLWWFPLVDATPRGSTVDAPTLGAAIYSSARSTPLTAALAKIGISIVRLAASDTQVITHLREANGAQVSDIASRLTLVTPIALLPIEQVFVDTVHDVLAACRRAPPRVLLASLDGAHDNLISIAGGPEDAAFAVTGDAYVLDTDVSLSTPVTRTRRRALVINANHALVRRARATADPRVAAAHVARGVLLQNRILDVDKSAAILDYTISRITRGPS